MVTQDANVVNVYGIHCRPSSAILKKVSELDSAVRIVVNGNESNLTSIIELLSLGIKCGDTVKIFAEGPNEVEDLATLVEAFEYNYDFKR